MFEQLFLQLLIVMLPSIAFQFMQLRRGFPQIVFQSRKISGFIWGATAMLCVTFGLDAGDGFYWDLRFAPLVLAFLYSGVRAGTIALILFLSYRVLVIGGDFAGVAVATGIGVLILPAYVAWRGCMNTLSSGWKIGVSILLSLFGSGTTSALFFYYRDLCYLPTPNPWLYPMLIVFVVIGVVVNCVFAEAIIKKVGVEIELLRIEKTGVISELAASVAHEVRNPLTVVRGFLQLLQERLDMKDQDRQYMGLVMGELDRAESILGEYLSFAKPQIETFDRVDVSALVESLGTIVLPLANASGVQFTLEVEPNLAIEGDRNKLQQCLINLTKNAIEATAAISKGEVKVIADTNHGAIRIRVIDNGVGMSQEHLQRLGTPYYSMKEKGTGLGLMTTFRLVEAMGGKLKFQSRQGAGTTAQLQFASAD